MSTEPIYIIGAGGHAKVVVDAMLAAGIAFERLRLSDNDATRVGTALLGVPVQTPAVRADMAGGFFHVAIGDGQVRARLHAELLAIGARPFTACHPRSVVSPSARLGAGVFIAALAVVGPDAVIGDGVIVNHGAVVDHDCRVDAYTHVAPNATLGGSVRLGAHVLVGAGATVLPGVHIATQAVIGAGAVVIHDVGAGVTSVGVPAVSLPKD